MSYWGFDWWRHIQGRLTRRKRVMGQDRTHGLQIAYVVSYLSFIIFIFLSFTSVFSSELPPSSRATILHRKRQRFAAMIEVNFVILLIVSLTQYY